MFESFLKQHDSTAWARARESLRPFIHEIDRNATDIWFHFYPLPLADAFAHRDKPEQLTRDLRLDHDWVLSSPLLGQYDEAESILRFATSGIVRVAVNPAIPSFLTVLCRPEPKPAAVTHNPYGDWLSILRRRQAEWHQR